MIHVGELLHVIDDEVLLRESQRGIAMTNDPELLGAARCANTTREARKSKATLQSRGGTYTIVSRGRCVRTPAPRWLKSQKDAARSYPNI